MIETLHKWSAEDVFRNLIETALAVIEDDPNNDLAVSRASLITLLQDVLQADKNGLAEAPKVPDGLPINIIPGSTGSECHPILIGLCHDADYLDERLRQILDHATRLCPRRNRLIVILSSQWNGALWKDVYLRQFEQIQASVHVYLFGPSGILSHVL